MGTILQEQLKLNTIHHFSTIEKKCIVQVVVCLGPQSAQPFRMFSLARLL
jgi:hypothetical protein